MKITRYLDARMNQRAIRKDLIELALDLGERRGDRCVLTTRSILKIRGILDEILQKGGLTVISKGDAVITAYRGVGEQERRSPHR